MGLIEDDGVEGPLAVLGSFDFSVRPRTHHSYEERLEPTDVIARNRVDVRFLTKSGEALLFGADTSRNGKIRQVGPLFNLGVPDSFCDEPGSDHKDSMDIEPSRESEKRGEHADGFAGADVPPNDAGLMMFEPLDDSSLVFI